MNDNTQKQTLYGFHSVEAVLQCRPNEISKLWLADSRQDKRVEKYLQLAAATNIPVKLVPRREMDRICGSTNHQGIALSAPSKFIGGEKELEQILSIVTNPLFLVLDGVQDVHNLGACMRSANALGVTGIILPERNSASINAVVHKTSAGAVEHLNLYRVSNLARSLRLFHQTGGHRIGLKQNAKMAISDIDLTPALALVLGSESKGLRRLTADHCDEMASIPMPGDVESLNLSVAAGICLYEANRQRNKTVEISHQFH